MTEVYKKDIDFIKRLTEVVNSNLSNEKFGVNDLSEQMGLSHSQIHRKLKVIKNQTISQFVKEIRLNKAQELLKQNNLTGSEVAYKVGFGSPSYFNKCYHDHFGYTPGESIKHLIIDEDKEIAIVEGYKQDEVVETRKRTLFKRNYLSLIAFLLMVVLLGLYFINKDKSVVNTNINKSIAILPLKNLNKDFDQQYLANGIMYDIQNRLSHIKDLVVKSNIPNDEYFKEDLTLPELAKKLKVAYILEGSILKQNDRIRIYIHLVDSNANIIWSDQYDHDMSSIFLFVSDVAKKIVQNLLPSLQVEYIQDFDKQYTYNEQAYRFYLEGRFYYRLRTAEGFKKSIELYQQALAVDSNYSLAYAGLADSYLTGTWNGFYSVSEGIPQCRYYLSKALSLDPNLAEAHATYGGLATYFDSDYKEAEKHLKIALEINPGYDRANKIYAEFFDVTGNKAEARKYINKAHLLNPTYSQILYLSYIFYCSEGEYDKAIKESGKIYNLNQNERALLKRSLQVYLQQHNDSFAYISYKKLNQKNSNAAVIDSVYHKSKIDGIIQLMIDSTLNGNNDLLNGQKELTLAEWYTLIGDKKSAIECLEKSYLKNPGPVHRVNYYTVYEPLKSEPRFRALMKKMNQYY